MASHRKQRPGGALGPGLRTPALATAAFTSVAVLSQTAEAAVPAGDGGPSVEEIEKKVNELYRRADSASAEDAAATRAAATRPAVRHQARVETPRQEDARRSGRRAKTLEGLAPFTAAPDTAAALLAEFPEDHFTQNRVLNRLASRVKGAAGQGGARRSPETPAAAQYDVKTVKAAVQRRLAAARELLSRATAPVTPRVTSPVISQVTPQAAYPTAFQEMAAHAARPVPPAAARPAVGRGWHRARLPAGPDATRAEQAVAFARAQIGKPYVSGASGPGSYDCAGLTQAAWKAVGVTLPRTASAQAVLGTPLPLADARAGDLVFFREDAGHVGLCTGDGMMIHAPRPGAYVCEESVHHRGDSVIHRVVRPA